MFIQRVTRGLAVAAVGGGLIAMTGLGLAAGVAQAATSPAGQYTATATVEGTTGSAPLTIGASTFTLVADGVTISGTWTEKGSTITLSGSLDGYSCSGTVQQISGGDLGSAASPGTLTLKGYGQIGTFYAVPG